MSDAFLPDYMRDALRSVVAGDPSAAASIEDRLTADLLAQLVSPDADTPKAVLDAMARTIAASSAISEETAQWNDRQGELLEALRDTPRVVVEYIDYLHRSMVGIQATVADGILSMADGFDSLEANADVLLSSIDVSQAPRTPAPAEPGCVWQPGVEFRFEPDNPYTYVVLAVRRDMACFAMRSPIDSTYTKVFACADFVELDRDATVTGRASVFGMADARAKFVEVHGETIDVWANR